MCWRDYPPFNTLKVSYGLAAGKVVVGMLGSDRRSELAVLGRPAKLQPIGNLQSTSRTAETTTLGEFNRVMALIGLDGFEMLTDIDVVALPKAYESGTFLQSNE